MAFFTEARSRTSPMKNLIFPAASGIFAWNSWRMSSCFFSSREKIRISRISVSRKRFSTAFPKEPVPPVIISVLLAKILIIHSPPPVSGCKSSRKRDTYFPVQISVVYFCRYSSRHFLRMSRASSGLSRRKRMALANRSLSPLRTQSPAPDWISRTMSHSSMMASRGVPCII